MKALRVALLSFVIALPTLADQHPNQLKGFNPENVYSVHDIDAINTFNGNLTLTIPLGPEFPVAEGFSYRLTLYGNMNAWDTSEVDHEFQAPASTRRDVATQAVDTCAGGPLNGVTVAHPHRRANAGMGWILTLGRLYAPGDPSRDGAGGWMYESPDGSEHVFLDKLHQSDPVQAGVSFTTDGTYLRMTETGNQRVIEFPDGSFHTFQQSPSGRGPWLPVALEHRGSNGFVHVTYPPNTNGTFDWVITDNHGRGHTVHFEKKLWDGGWKAIATSVELAAFPNANGSQRKALYQLNYHAKQIGRPEWHDQCVGFDRGATVHFLDSVVLPDESGSRYSFRYNESTGILSKAGMPLSVVLPTGGVIEWDPHQWMKPADSAGGFYAHFGYSWGVGKRHRKLSVGGPSIATWEYHQRFDWFNVATGGDFPREMKTIVVDPDGAATASYFSVATPLTEGGVWEDLEYGKPFTKNKGDGDVEEDGRQKWLSQEQYGRITHPSDPDKEHCSRTEALSSCPPEGVPVLRSTYLKYEVDDNVANWRVQASRVVHHDDVEAGAAPTDPHFGAQWVDTIHDDFDRFGHYRITKVKGSPLFGLEEKTTTTDYNFGRGSSTPYPLIPNWTLGTFASVVVTEGTQSSRSEYCFDEEDGLLNAVRSRRASSGLDLLVTYHRDSGGNVDQENYFGGDDPSFTAPLTTCGGSGTPRYTLDHVSDFGVRLSTNYSGQMFKALDLDIDESTGLPSASRDSAGIETKYLYNLVGQLRAVEPAGAVPPRPSDPAWTEYTYAIDPAPTEGKPHATVTARQWPNRTDRTTVPTGVPLTETRYYYDAFGRLIQQRRRMPDAPSEHWSVSEIEYDHAGRKLRTSVAVTSSSGDYSALPLGTESTHIAYDALGRPESATMPDGSVALTKYKGTRRVARSATIATTESLSTTVWNAEHYDAHGRLNRVVENADGDEGSAPDAIETRYKYDEGNRLVLVDSAGDQERTFSYDGAGLLTEEDHPELAKTYYTYDARGHVVTKIVSNNAPNGSNLSSAAVALRFDYDSAERLQTVTDAKANQPLKVLTYDPTLGRLVSQTRHNYFTDSTYTVTDTFSYDDTTGRPTSKATNVARDNQPLQTFNHVYDYTELGAPEHVNYPTCLACGGVATGSRNLLLGYQNGFLTGIDKVTSTSTGTPGGIKYTPAGAVHQVQHRKAGGGPGVLETFFPDPSGMARISSIQFDDLLPICLKIDAPNPTVDKGNPAALTVTVTGTGPFTYKWYLGALNDTSNLVGIEDHYNTPSLLLSTDYWVEVKNSCGTAKQSIHVNVVDCGQTPVVTASGASIPPGTSALLTAAATGTEPMLFEWFAEQPNSASIVIHTGPSFTTPNLTVSRDYWVRATNSCGSDTKLVHVNVEDCGAITIQVVPSAFAEGSPVQLRAPSLAGATYRWYRVVAGLRFLLATTQVPTYDVSSISDATVYAAELQNGTCVSPSNELVVQPCLKKRVIDVSPSNDEYLLSIADDQPGVTFQWYEGFNYQDLSKPRGAGSGIFVKPVVATHYWVRMTLVCGGVTVVINSDFALVDLLCHPSIFVQPVSMSVTRAAGSVSATVAGGGAGPFTYQWWEAFADGGTRIITEDAAAATYTWAAPSFAGNEYGQSREVFVKVYQGSTVPATSDRVILAFANDPQRIESTSGSVVRPNSVHYAHLFVTMHPPPSADHEYTYEWYADNGTAEGERFGHTLPSFSTTATGSYWVVIKGVHYRGGYEYHEETVSQRMFVSLGGECLLSPLHVEQSLMEICLGGSTTQSPMVIFRAFNDTPNVVFQWYLGQTGDTREPIDSDPGQPDQLTIYGNKVQKVWVRASLDCGASLDSPTHSYTRGACAPLFIDQDLPGIEAEWGSNAQLAFPALSDPDTAYQWYEQPLHGAPPVGILGATGPTLVLQAIAKSGFYFVHVRDLNCPNSGSSTFPSLVRVSSAPGMTPPVWVTEVWRDSDFTSGTVLSAVTAGGVRWQWFQGTVLDESHPVSDTTQPTFTTPNLTADTRYWVRVHGSGGKFLDSPTITVKVCNVPRLTATQEAQLILNREVFANQSTTFFVPFNQPAGGTKFVYQWYRGARLDETQPLGEHGTSLEVRQWNTTQYWFRASSACGVNGSNPREYNSPTFTATVCAMPEISVQPTAVPARSFSGDPVVLSVTASVTPSGPLSYQWYEGAAGVTSAPVPGGTSASITVSPTGDRTYWVRVTRGVCVTDSAAVTVLMCTYPKAVNIPATINIAHGASTTIQFPSLYPGDVKITRWYRGPVGDRSNLVAGSHHPALDFTTPALTETTQYWMEFEHYGCLTTTSTATIVTVCKSTITAQPVGATIANGANHILTVGTTPIPGQTFAWFIGAPGNTSNPVPGGTTASITVSPSTTTSYWVRVKGTCTPDAFAESDGVTVTICVPPVLTTTNFPRSIEEGQQTAVGLSATGSNLSYQWYRGTSGTTTNLIAGATSPLHYVSPSVTTSYWCRVTSESLCAANSETMTVDVCVKPTVTQPVALPARAFAGTSVSLSVTATAGGPMTYQWYVGNQGTITSPIAGATSPTVTVNPTAQTTYWVRVKTGVCTRDSAAVTVYMCTYPQTVTLPAKVNIAYGASTALPFPSLYPGDVKTIRWYRGASGDRSSLVAAGNLPSLNFTTPALTATTQYWVEFEHNGCITTSSATTVTVCVPTITAEPVGGTIASGSSRMLTVATTPIAGQTYQWYMGAPGTTSSPVSGGTSASISVSPTATTSYWVRVKGTCTPEATTDSAAAIVTVCNVPVISAIGPPQSIESGQTATLYVMASGSNLAYQWYVGTSGTLTSPVSGATSNTFLPSPTSTTSYWCRVTSAGLCTVNSATMTVDVCTRPVITQQPLAVPQRIFNGGSATLSVTATGNGPLMYQWYVGAPGVTSTPVAGGTSATISVSPTVETSYWVRVTTRVCSTVSAGVTVSMCTYAQGVTLPANVNIAYGATTTLQFPTLYPGDVKTIRWYRGASGDRTNLVTSGHVPSLNFTTPALTATTQYWMEFEHNGCLTTSTATTVTVCKPTITAEPQGAIILSGASHTLSVTATGSPLTYQWYIGASGVTSQPVGGATTPSLTVTPSSTTTYWVRASGCSTNADSAAATVTVCAAPAVTSLTKTLTYKIGDVGTITVTATGTSLTYQWFKGQSGDTSQPISGATAASYTFTLQTSQYYWARVTSGCNGATANSTAVLYSVQPKITAHPANVTIPRNTSTTLSTTATGTYLSYQWFSGSSSTMIVGATSATYTTPVLATGVSEYWCEVKSGTIGANSLHAFVSLCDGPTIVSFTQTYNSGTTYRLTVMVHSSQYGLVDYHWYQGVPGDLSQSTYLGESQYGHQQYFVVTTPTTYWVRVRFKDGSCYRDTAGKTLP